MDQDRCLPSSPPIPLPHSLHFGDANARLTTTASGLRCQQGLAPLLDLQMGATVLPVTLPSTPPQSVDSGAPRAAPWHNKVCPVSQPEGNSVQSWRHRARRVRTAGCGADCPHSCSAPTPSSVGHGALGGQNAKPWGGETAGRGVKVTPAVTDTH